MKTKDTYTEQLQNIKIYTYKNLKNIQEGKSPNTEDLLEAIAISTNKDYQTVVSDYLKLKEIPYKEREGELLSISYTLKNNTKLEQKPKGFGMDLYHVTFYYLATGMDGIADEKDFGYIKANSEEDALEYVVMNEEKWRADYPKGDAYRYWGLSADKVY